MKKFFTLTSFSLIAAIMAMFFAGCGTSDSKTQVIQAQSGTAASSAAPVPSGKPAEISIFFDNTSTVCDRSNTPVLKEIEKMTNTKITIVQAPNGQGNEKLNLLISSGDVPEIIKANDKIINKYGIEGAIYSLEDIIGKQMPIAKQKLSKDVINKLKASDNKLYTLPLIRDTGYGAFFVREDWLKKLNLNPPKTLDEYYAMLKAFTENDPDGDGKKDTFGTALGNTLSGFELISGPFGIPAAEWFPQNDGSVVYSAVNPKMKDALAFAAKLYKEGIIDPEFSTQQTPQYEEKVTNNHYGLIYNWSSGAMRLEGILKKTVPDAKYVVLNVPTAPGVSKGISGVSTIVEGTNEKSINGFVAISKNAKDVGKVAKFLDWFFTDESATVVTYGMEGKHYTLENGKPKFKPEYYGAENIAKRQQEGIWDIYLMCGVIDQRSVGWPQVWSAGAMKNMEGTISNSWPKVIYFTTPTGDSSGPEIDKTRIEIFTKIIMGGVSADDGWNLWLKEFDRLGGNKWTKEVNDIYKSRK